MLNILPRLQKAKIRLIEVFGVHLSSLRNNFLTGLPKNTKIKKRKKGKNLGRYREEFNLYLCTTINHC